MGTKNGAIPLEDYLEVSYKTKYNLTLWSSIHALGFTKRNRKLMSTQNLHTDIYNSFIHNCQNSEARCLSGDQ